jgi:cytochrome c-type biogenesis protein CcmH
MSNTRQHLFYSSRFTLISPLFLALLLASLAAIQAEAGAIAQEATPPAPNVSLVTDDAVNAVAKQLYCPVCENIPLDVCPTQACAQWRALIREMLAQGKSESEIKDYFVRQYGDRVLASPPARGLNLLVYVIPPLAILVGAFILYRAMRSWKTSAPPGMERSVPPEGPGDEYIARLEEELRRR